MRHIMPLLAAGAAVLCTGAVNGDLGDQLAKLLADDGAQGDLFGNSVAISGDTAIVGALGDDDNGDISGSAYLFDTAKGVQIAKLLPSDGEEHDLFGSSVAISGTTAIVGAFLDDDNGVGSGSAYLFDTTTGVQIAKLLPEDGAIYDWFGYSVAISDTTAVVGAYGDGDNGYNSGSAYLFDNTTGRQIAKLLPDDGAFSAQFGYAVAISGNTAIVAAPWAGHDGSNYGLAYLFDATTGKQTGKLVPNLSEGFFRIGRSIAINDDIAILGAWIEDDNGGLSGAAFLFDTLTGRQLAELRPDDVTATDFFGDSVGISGATAIVGAFADDANGSWSGSAYLFDTVAGRRIAKILPIDGEAHDEFGISVAITGAPGNELAIVGAIGDGDNGDSSGSAYLFDAGDPGECPWDLDGNDSVGVSDLLSLLTSWGPCDGCFADFDGDGNVGDSDLALLLANWGPCL